MCLITEQEEREHLEVIKSGITQTIQAGQQLAKRKAAELLEQKTYLRDNKEEKAILHQSVTQMAGSGEAALAKVKQLQRLLQTPYFGRIDFKEKEHTSAQPVYIGVCALKDPDSHSNLVYDWRAPVSSMFYDFETGTAFYQAPAGERKGEITLKRQYRIKDGQLEFMIDTAAHIYDELLQRELSNRSDEKMKNIVATIQKDQHAVIREEEAPVLVIQGVAGSGKTSIALHRIAFLLYKHRENISSNDILILSPNKIFSDYISNVLPELGEENIPETSIGRLVNELLNNKYVFQTLFEQTSTLMENKDAGLSERTNFKSSFDFLHSLNEYAVYLNNHFFQPEALPVGRYLIPSTVVAEQYASYHRLPLLKRIPETAGAIVRYLQYKHGYEATAADKSLIKKALTAMSGSTNVLQLYKAFFTWCGKPGLFKMLPGKVLEHPDAFGLAYLSICLEGVRHNRKVKHLLIDEMQDYIPVQYAIISKLFSCKLTLLGDINQSLNPAGKMGLDIFKKLFPQSQQVKLNKSYRSTFEIICFAQQIAPNSELIPVERHGKVPGIYIEKDPAAEVTRIHTLIMEFAKNNSYKSLAIICKTEKEAAAMMETLTHLRVPVSLLTAASNKFTDGVMVISAHLAKGLEFDKVIIPMVTEKNYQTDMDRSMLYIACTRAMHELDITCSGRIAACLQVL
ncbi:HelD family protein [Chitinophaga flava]|uniref:DNA 3'-5' helicase n=1 Tax=Chitinophaga flava TaxID=2259036 RepID=A0A365XR50_9BACT|nr:3'-5' exonuclease [Chitinophaga flava]RBL88837.1 helicase [Chitinophaga flava]